MYALDFINQFTSHRVPLDVGCEIFNLSCTCFGFTSDPIASKGYQILRVSTCYVYFIPHPPLWSIAHIRTAIPPHDPCLVLRHPILAQESERGLFTSSASGRRPISTSGCGCSGWKRDWICTVSSRGVWRVMATANSERCPINSSGRRRCTLTWGELWCTSFGQERRCAE